MLILIRGEKRSRLRALILGQVFTKDLGGRVSATSASYTMELLKSYLIIKSRFMNLKFDILYLNMIQDSITVDVSFCIKFYRQNLQISTRNTSWFESSKFASLFTHE